ncbi:type IV toxin-antitoxin system AbiEi family antitoxin [Nocardioides marinisabuli]|uniref:type IV toxin-antitoxin system AbiEi family antitoxin n=1 Tax=Nocardioides marinisabuli TaxID=419476 RepID=UPI0015DDF3A7|nr:type IV toxin-antitoxin system AbiEi family antitoxin [Nocardioides marinisabuli]
MDELNAFGWSGDEFWTALRAALTEWDVHLEPDEELRERGRGHALVQVADQHQQYAAVVATSLAVRAAAAQTGWSGSHRLVVSDKISPRAGELLRRSGIDYLDLTGAASLRFGSVVVALSGSGRPPMRLKPPASTELLVLAEPRATNLFSAARAQVVAALLAWPQIVAEPVRRIAEHAGVSIGLVHDVLRLLDEDGYLARWGSKDLAVADASRLLDAWTAAYRSGLRKRLHLGSFRSELSRWDPTPQGVLVGGEMAVQDLISAASVTVYAHRLDTSLLAGQRMVPTQEGANTEVLHRFWSVPPGVDATVIPWPLTYAELATSPDARVRESAATFRGVRAG